MRALLMVAATAAVACSGRIKPIDPPPPDAGCGDGLINAQLGEECEGSDLNGATCQTLGFDTGTLSCADCKLIKTLCVKRCGNGMLESGEACDGDAGVPGCSDFGYVSCSPTCTVDRAHCVTTPYQSANGALFLNPGGPAVVADLAPRGLGELVIVVEDRFRVESSKYSVQMGFDSSTSKFSFGKDPVQAIGHGFDIVALNRDGTLDRYAYDGGTFGLQPFPAGCSARILGEVGGAVATSSCDAGEVIVWGASVTRAPSNGGVCSLADWDLDGTTDVLSLAGTSLEAHLPPSYAAVDAGVLPVAVTSLVGADFDDDGDLDLAGVTSGGANVKLFENLGASGFADRLTLPGNGATTLFAGDLDLDGRVDLVWATGFKASVRRNQGSWVFAPYEATFTTDAGAELSFSVGDVDGDGDLDLVSTHASGGTTSTSFVQLNRVR